MMDVNKEEFANAPSFKS